MANSNQLYFNNLVKTLCHKTPYRCPHRLNLSSQSSHSCAGPNIKVLKDKDLEFANSIPPIFATSLCKIAGCNYSYINQLCGKSRKLVSRIKVSLFSSWRVNETERGTVLGLSWIGLREVQNRPSRNHLVAARASVPHTPSGAVVNRSVGYSGALVRGEKALHSWVTEPNRARWSRDTWP